MPATEAKRFHLGTEDVLTVDHIGALITIDARTRVDNFRGSKEWRDRCWHGRLEWFQEDRGTFTLEPGDGEPTDHVGDEQYKVEIGLRNGPTVTITENDRATITIFQEA